MNKEKFVPPSNLPPGRNVLTKLIYFLRCFADLQIASLLFYLKPWLQRVDKRILEVGCGAQPYRHMLSKKSDYTGLDWEESKNIFGYQAPQAVYYKGGKFPFGDQSFDYVFHTEVLEHVWDYRQFLSECVRVLKPEGKMFLAMPFQGRYHYIPQDFWRFTPAALTRLLEEAGFKEIKIFNRGTDITVAMYKFVSVIYRWLSRGIFTRILGLLFIPFALLALIVAHITIVFGIGSPDDCLGYAVEAVRKN
ncbi:MAG: methyltransferase domain-containing protein [Candidatus Omnitrophica bacterium]|nr:methyltransferase domain-containing protein [Candidatus Omnitrophota bacterium]